MYTGQNNIVLHKHHCQRYQGYFRFWDLVGAPPKFQGFSYLVGNSPLLHVVTNQDVISYAYLFPSEGIEIISELIHQLLL